MTEGFEQLKKRISWFREKKPVYKEILDFYEVIWEAQDEIEAAVKVKPIEIKESLKEMKLREGFPLLKKEDFYVDISASQKLFASILERGEKFPTRLREEMAKLKQAFLDKSLDIEKVLSKYLDEKFLKDTADEFKIDYPALSFLVRTSVEPSIKANAGQFKGEKITLDNWPNGYCPICGSQPRIAEVRGEGGQKYALCSFCGYEWRIARVTCPFCGNKDQKTLHYLFVEEEEYYRADFCDQCHQYLKGVDSRKLDYKPVLLLEDLVTFHLDILASKKGFQRPVPLFGPD